MISTEYAAGFFDGEGCVSINYVPQRNKGYKGRIGYYRVKVSIGNTNGEVLTLFKERWGGGLSFKEARILNHKPVWTWNIWAQQTVGFLEDILPYLIIKHRVAEIGIAVMESYKNNKFCRYRPIDQGIANARAEWLRELRALNYRGVGEMSEVTL